MFQKPDEYPSRGESHCTPGRPQRTSCREATVQAISPASVPRCCLTEQDVHLLEEAARIYGGQDSAVHRALAQKIQSSTLELSEDIPAGYAKLNDRVTFSVNGRVTLSRVLVHWNSFVVPGRDLSLATPWGIALLGTRPGHEAPVYWRGGIAEMIRVEAVEQAV